MNFEFDIHSSLFEFSIAVARFFQINQYIFSSDNQISSSDEFFLIITFTFIRHNKYNLKIQFNKWLQDFSYTNINIHNYKK